MPREFTKPIPAVGAASKAVRTCDVETQATVVRVLAGPDAGLERTFSHPVVRVGADPDNDLALTDESVSRFHLELTRTGEGIAFRDLGSTNGTRAGGISVREGSFPQKAELALGQTRLEIRASSEKLSGMVVPGERFAGMVGRSERMVQLFARVEAVAKASVTVLVRGPTGTGKELIARTLHERSQRPGPLVVFDAASCSAEMIQSDLFGHVRGAFTGAADDRAGAFRKANGGTLFIDEIGELPLDMQPRLLRVLETRRVRPVGGDQDVRVDVRVVAATHRDLLQMVTLGLFREDLYHRLSVVTVDLPPLSERRRDIPDLVAHFVERLDLSCSFSQAAIEALQEHSWPGNVRALRNVVERAAALHPGKVVEPDDLEFPEEPATMDDSYSSFTAPLSVPPPPPPPSVPPPRPLQSVPPGRSLQDAERETIQAALVRNRWNKTAAARELGISLSTLKRRVKEYQLED
jgi:DNA-binding NtrC family response regulator